MKAFYISIDIVLIALLVLVIFEPYEVIQYTGVVDSYITAVSANGTSTYLMIVLLDNGNVVEIVTNATAYVNYKPGDRILVLRRVGKWLGGSRYGYQVAE
jgi:hypothetical protein